MKVCNIFDCMVLLALVGCIAGSGECSTSGSVYSSDPVSVPTLPSDPSATATSSSQINLAWMDNSNNETGFKIEHKNVVSGAYAQIATTSANATSYSDSGHTASTVSTIPGSELPTALENSEHATDIYTTTQINAKSEGSIWKSTGGLGESSTDSTIDVASISVDPTDGQVVYATSTRRGVFKSDNGGVNWVSANKGLPGRFAYNIVVSPSNSQVLYLVTGFDIFKSTNGASSWVATSSGLPKQQIAGISIDPKDDQVLYVATGAGNAVYKTIDGGKRWESASNGINKTNIIGVSSVTVAPNNSQTVYATTNGIYGVINGDIYKSIDGGNNWVVITSGLSAPYFNLLSVDPTNSEIIYSRNTNGLYKSSDGGTSWSLMGNGLDYQVDSLAIDQNNNQILYAGTGGVPGNGVYKSINGGTSWTATNDGLTKTTVRAICVDPTNSSIVYAGTFNGIYKTIIDGL